MPVGIRVQVMEASKEVSARQPIVVEAYAMFQDCQKATSRSSCMGSGFCSTCALMSPETTP